MKTVALLFAWVLSASLAAQSQPAAQSSAVVFIHVTVIDVAATSATRALKLDQTVIITGEHITALGETGKLQIPEGAQVIDATGKFLMPGLWDMHVHMANDSASALKLFLANGVTGVRDMGTALERLLPLRQQIASGSLLGPRMVVSGPSIFGVLTRKEPGDVSNAEEARTAVRQRKQAGADFLKLYSYLPPEAFFAAMDEAKKQGMTAVGHVPFGIKASEAARAGLKSIEHLEGVVIEATGLENALRQEISERIREGKLGLLVPQIEMDQAQRYHDSYDPKRLQELNAAFVKYHTWQCPTLTGPESTALAADAMSTGFAGYPHLEYVSQATQDSWKRLLSTRFSPEQIPNLKVYAAYKRVLTAAMHRAGVQFLSGTDVQGGTTYLPGFSLHDELAILVQVGFSPTEALQTATINPARFLGRENELGTIERGKLADLVLLDANPLDNIANTRGIRAVIVNGTYLDKEALQGMLAVVESAASRQ